MRLNKTEREEFRKRVKILILQMEKLKIVYHFKKEGYPRKTIYNNINQFGRTITTKRKLVAQPPRLLPEESVEKICQ